MALETNIVGSNLDGEGNIKTTLTLTPANMGGVRLFSENDPGDITGDPDLASPETSNDYRLRVGIDSVLDTEEFNYAAQNFNKHKYVSTTMTITWAGGAMNTNGSNITTTATACQFQTYRHFPMLGSGQLYAESILAFSAAMPTNVVIDFGLFLPGAAGTATPLDGCYFRATNSGIIGIANNNGTETPTAVFSFTPTINRFYKFNITVSQAAIEFWIDDVLYGVIPRSTGAGQPFMSASLPFALRHNHTGAAGAVINAKFAGYTVTVGDIATNRLWATTMAGQGMAGIQGASGMAAGMLANNINITAPVAATLANATAGYATLGGKFVFAAVAGAETDYALFAYLVPAPTTSISGRNLIIRGIWIDTFNAVVAVATTPTVLEWSLAVGSTAVTLLTVDAAATRLPKRICLGVQSFLVGDLAGKQAPRIDVNLDAPLIAEPGTYVHVILRMPYGTATATELFRGQVGINAFWE